MNKTFTFADITSTACIPNNTNRDESYSSLPFLLPTIFLKKYFPLDISFFDNLILWSDLLNYI